MGKEYGKVLEWEIKEPNVSDRIGQRHRIPGYVIEKVFKDLERLNFNPIDVDLFFEIVWVDHRYAKSGIMDFPPVEFSKSSPYLYRIGRLTWFAVREE